MFIVTEYAALITHLLTVSLYYLSYQYNIISFIYSLSTWHICFVCNKIGVSRLGIYVSSEADDTTIIRLWFRMQQNQGLSTWFISFVCNKISVSRFDIPFVCNKISVSRFDIPFVCNKISGSRLHSYATKSVSLDLALSFVCNKISASRLHSYTRNSECLSTRHISFVCNKIGVSRLRICNKISLSRLGIYIVRVSLDLRYIFRMQQNQCLSTGHISFKREKRLEIILQ